MIVEARLRWRREGLRFLGSAALGGFGSFNDTGRAFLS